MSIQGKTVVFTGKISQPRHAFQAMVEEHGGIAGGDITKNTDYLVVGEKPGSKLFRAASLGVPTISESQFLQLLEEPIEEQQTPSSNETLQETISRLLENRVCYFCKRTYKEFKSWPDYDTCCFCEVAYTPKCPNCGSTNLTFATNFKLYNCDNCEKWFKAPFVHGIHRTELLHYWYKKIKINDGRIKEECPCGTVKITHPDGTWEKHEPHYIIERARKIAHKHAVEEEREFRLRQEEVRRRIRGESMILKQLEALSPSQLNQLEEQLKEKEVTNESL